MSEQPPRPKRMRRGPPIPARPARIAATPPLPTFSSPELEDHLPIVADTPLVVPPLDLPAIVTKAVPSPAFASDAPPPAAAAPDASIEGSLPMATIASPTDAADQAQAAFGDVQSRMQSLFARSSKMGEEMLEFTRGNVEAAMTSARAAAKAGEALGTEAADYGRKSMEQATAAMRSFAAVKSPTELFQLQGEFAKASFDQAVAEASKLSEAMIKYAGEIAQPLSNRYALAVEKIKAVAA